MTVIEWKPDSCQCIIRFESRTQLLVKTSELCQIHKEILTRDLLQTIRDHNAQFSAADKQVARKTEYDRILARGNPVKIDRTI